MTTGEPERKRSAHYRTRLMKFYLNLKNITGAVAIGKCSKLQIICLIFYKLFLQHIRKKVCFADFYNFVLRSVPTALALRNAFFATYHEKK